jgi:hypothetical protein
MHDMANTPELYQIKKKKEIQKHLLTQVIRKLHRKINNLIIIIVIKRKKEI